MINLRSPYFVKVENASLTSAAIQIYIYGFNPALATWQTDRGTAIYTLSATAYDDGTNDPYCIFDISELARDYIDYTFDGTYTGKTLWVEWRTANNGAAFSGSYSGGAAFYGYNEFREGAFGSGIGNDYTAPNLLMSNTDVIYKSDDGIINIPIFTASGDSITVYLESQGTIISTDSFAYSNEVGNTIRYVSNDTGVDYESFKTRVIADSGTFEDDATGRVFTKYGTSPVDVVYIDDGTDITRIPVKNIPECKYEPLKLTFINRFGALEDIWFFKLSSVSLSTKDTSYKANIISGGTYSTTAHQYATLSINGKERITMNSGFYPESYNEVFKQMLLSDRVWLLYEGYTLPIKITSNDFNFKKHVNNKLIEYTIEADFSFDNISSVR